MKYLLDTHVFIWSILDKKKISPRALSILQDFNNQFFISTITLWEISLKFSVGKLLLEGLTPEMLPTLTLEMGYQILDLKAVDASTFHQLKGNWHKDPFDRMLVVQCLHNNLILISKDENIKKYAAEGLKVEW
jgi:PIN domain nuclease of toxin-antitoxin system